MNNENYNNDYFADITTEHQAYFLGLIAADGCIFVRKKGNNPRSLTICLQEEDGLAVLPVLAKHLGREVRVSYPPAIQARGWKKRVILQVSSDKLCGDLAKYGVLPNKTKNGVQFPNLPPELVRHYIRGYLDGNGSIVTDRPVYKYECKVKEVDENRVRPLRTRVMFTSTDVAFLEQISKALNVHTMNSKVVRSCVIMSVERKDDVQKVLNYMYDDATVYLPRKYAKVISSRAESTLSEGSETTGVVQTT